MWYVSINGLCGTGGQTLMIVVPSGLTTLQPLSVSDTSADTCKLNTKKEILVLLLSEGTFALDFTESGISAKGKS